MATIEDFEDVVRAQKDLQLRIGNLLPRLQATELAKPGTISLYMLDVVFKSLCKYWDDFYAAHQQLVRSEHYEASSYRTEDVFGSTELDYVTAMYFAEQLRAPLRPRDDLFQGQGAHGPLPQQQQQNNPPADFSSQPLQLRFDLPEFSGNYTDWESFRDAFQGLVIDRPGTPAVQKLILLKKALKGEAANLLRNVANTDANFKPAWDTVCKRYTNHRVLVHAHLKELFNLPSVARESARDLHALLDRAREELRALGNLGCRVADVSEFISFMILQRVDPVTRREWEMEVSIHGIGAEPANKAASLEDGGGPIRSEWQELDDFLERRIRAVEMSSPTVKASNPIKFKDSPVPSQKKMLQVHHAQNPTPSFKEPSLAAPSKEYRAKRRCRFCQGEHGHMACPEFKRLTPEQRLAEVKRLNLCFNCIGEHRALDYKSSGTCHVCSKQHNTMLHLARPTSTQKNLGDSTTLSPEAPAFAPGDNKVHSYAVNRLPCSSTVVLATALVTIVAPSGGRITTRALLDSGSEASFVSERIARCLDLLRTRINTRLTGIGGDHAAGVKAKTSCNVVSRVDDNFQLTLDVLILPTLTGLLPQKQLLDENVVLQSGLELADPHFWRPEHAGLILGAEVFFGLLREGQKRIPGTNLMAQNTWLGWVISGCTLGPEATPRPAQTSPEIRTYRCAVSDDLDQTLRRFFDLETVPGTTPASESNDDACERHFKDTTERLADGRYQVRLPMAKQLRVEHGNNFHGAKTALLSLERRFQQDPGLSEQYHDFMGAYEELGHMVRAAPLSTDQAGWYLPHQGVRTHKLRVVFDAARRNSHDCCLNNFLLPGPALQSNLLEILLAWRLHRFVFSADIVKIYRQILIHPDDWNKQRILWRESEADDIQHYCLKTVTYGTSSAPYLAISVLKQLADDKLQRFPLGAQALRAETYVDDILSGADTFEAAAEKRDQLIGILDSAGMTLAK